MLFIGKPMGRSIMISNVSVYLCVSYRKCECQCARARARKRKIQGKIIE